MQSLRYRGDRQIEMLNKKLDTERTEEKIQHWGEIAKGIFCTVREGRRRRQAGTKKGKWIETVPWRGEKRRKIFLKCLP